MKKIITIFMAAVITVSAAWLALRPDVRFIATAAVESAFASEKLPEKTGITARKYTLDELSEREDVEFNDDLILVNTSHTLENTYIPTLVDYKETGILLTENFSEAFTKLNTETKNSCGEGLYFSSGYRSFAEQEQVYSEEGSDTAQLPGASEHMTGLAADVYVNGFAGKSIIKSPTGRYVNNNCCKFGFVIRYPFGKKSVTGISYEPWHLRYVGLPHSEIITKNGLTLEEYVDLFEYGEWYSYGEYVISRQQGDELFVPETFSECSISPDNCGGYFVTAHR